MCVRVAEYLDKDSPFMQQSWATTETQVQLLFSTSNKLGKPRQVCPELDGIRGEKVTVGDKCC